MKKLLCLPFLFLCFVSNGQVTGVPFGKVTMADLSMKRYEKDTTANAVVLEELGTARIGEKENEDLVFERYVKIKIFNKEGYDAATFTLPLKRNGSYTEGASGIEGTTYNLVNGTIQQTKLENKDIFRENLHLTRDVVKFTLPNIQEGSVIEVRYKISSPFITNFRTWTFQDDIPKVHSEYLTVVPGNFVYNVVLKGFRKLTKNESSIVKNCFGTRESECVQSIYAMDDIEAFVEEDYMTSRENFESAIVFELSQITLFDGRVDKRTKEWRDVDIELQQEEDFGLQIKKAKSLYSNKVAGISNSTDTLIRATTIYDFVRKWYNWNEYHGIWTQLGVKKAYDTKSGSVGDINLSLVGAMQAAGITAYPVLLSTRENGLPIQLHPVISNFNYVVVSVLIAGKTYLLDASASNYPFGMIPQKCMNGKGRMMSKVSTWIELKPGERQKSSTTINLSLASNSMEGSVATNYQGYEAIGTRSQIKAAGQREDYVASLEKYWKDVDFNNYQVKNLDSLEVPLKETMTMKKEIELQGGMLYFNPFLFPAWEKNPFRASARTYPVDFGSPFDEIYTMTITYPADYSVEETPTPAAINLAKGGGKMFFNVSELGNKITLTFSLSINRPIFDPVEYTALKDFFARVALIKQSQIVFKKKA